MRVLMISRSEYGSDVRVRRETEALVGAGHSVVFVGIGESQRPHPEIEVLGIPSPQGISDMRPGRPGPVFHAIRWMLLPQHRRRAIEQFLERTTETIASMADDFDVVHCHDYPALPVGVEAARGSGAALVYDSHEIWSDMFRPGRDDRRERERMRRQEAQLAASADHVITVSPAAAQVLGRRFGRDDVLVVRNTFPISSGPGPRAEPQGVVYQGRIASGRDLQTAFEAFRTLDAELHLMGPVEPSFKIPEHVIAHPAGNMDEVDSLLVSCGIALVPLTRGPLNHDVALPNKLFQAVANGVPVVAANLQAMREEVLKFGLGEMYEPGDVESLRDAVERIVLGYPEYSSRVMAARPSFDWATVDSRVLTETYEAISQRGLRRRK